MTNDQSAEQTEQKKRGEADHDWQDAFRSESVGDPSVEAMEFPFCSVAEWQDEDKPNTERKWRRRRPIEGAWVILGNDELWLIPEVRHLGKDIAVEEKRGLPFLFQAPIHPMVVPLLPQVSLPLLLLQVRFLLQ